MQDKSCYQYPSKTVGWIIPLLVQLTGQDSLIRVISQKKPNSLMKIGSKSNFDFFERIAIPFISYCETSRGHT